MSNKKPNKNRYEPPFIQANKSALAQVNTKMLREYPKALDLWEHLNALSNRSGAVIASQVALGEMMPNKHGKASSRSTVNRAVKYLHDNGYIKIGKIGNQNVYIINDHITWQKAHDTTISELDGKGIKFDTATVLTKQENRKIYDEYRKFKRTPPFDLGKVHFSGTKHGRVTKNGEIIKRHHQNQYTRAKAKKQRMVNILRKRLYAIEKSYGQLNGLKKAYHLTGKSYQLSMFGKHTDYSAHMSKFGTKKASSSKHKRAD